MTRLLLVLFASLLAASCAVVRTNVAVTHMLPAAASKTVAIVPYTDNIAMAPDYQAGQTLIFVTFDESEGGEREPGACHVVLRSERQGVHVRGWFAHGPVFRYLPGPVMRTWDLAPMKILIEEAGGRWTAFDGSPSIETGTAICSNGLLHDQILRALRG